MATIRTSASTTPSTINKFLGLNVGETSDTQIKLGESGNMSNFYITDDYKLKKMYGYKQFNKFDTPIRGIYGAKIGTVGYLLLATGGKLYRYLQEDLDDESKLDDIEPLELGDIADTYCSFFEFNNCIYVICDGYYKYDGNSFTEVEGYIPCVMISTNPLGSGTEYEDINLLTGKKHQTFNGDGSSVDFVLAQDNITSVDKVIVDGEELNSDAYNVNLVNGIVSFQLAPTGSMDNVDIYWTKDDGDRHIIENMKYGIVFGGAVDTRVFLYGSDSLSNKVFFSSTEDGKPSAEYFTGFAQADIGPSNYSITDLTRQYDRLVATTNKPEAYRIEIGTETLEIVLGDGTKVGKYVPSIAVYPLNEAHGNLAPHQGQVLNNYPVTIDNSGFVMWKATNVRDEKNATVISGRIQEEIDNMNKELFKTYDNQIDGQMFFANGNRIYIYNYNNDTFSKLDIKDEVEGFAGLNNSIYMATTDGKITKWNKNYTTYNGEIIKAHWEMNFSDFGAFYLRKTMRKLWVQMQPTQSSSAEIGYITNLMVSPVKKYISYRANDGFSNVDFGYFSFQVSTNPQPFRLKLKAKKFTNMKVTIDNEEDTACTILGLAMKVESFGESK